MLHRLLTAAALAALGAAFFAALDAPPPAATPLADAALARLPDSGVSSPVTAVLLNFRAYDTLLEVAVLLLALASVWALRIPAPPSPWPPASPVVATAARRLTPALLLIGAYLVWIGADAPGGAFQGGALLGASVVLLVVTGAAPPARPLPLRLALVAGLLVFALAGLAGPLLGRPYLTWPPSLAKPFILLVEVFATLSIALTLAALFVGVPPERPDPGAPR